MESAIRALGFFGEYISEETMKTLIGLLGHPRYACLQFFFFSHTNHDIHSRLRVAVVETLGMLGSRSMAAVPQMIQLLKADDDNWLRTVATTQLTNLLKDRSFEDSMSSLRQDSLMVY